LLVVSAAGAAETRTVTIESMQFAPAVTTVRQGDTVVWINRDLVPHTATAARVFDSGEIAAGSSWKMIAKTKGRFDYVCTMHPTMKATLVVE
jgi:plastocyanin